MTFELRIHETPLCKTGRLHNVSHLSSDSQGKLRVGFTESLDEVTSHVRY